MKKFQIFLFIVGTIATSLQTFAQQGENSPERFYNVEMYKADITLTFEYRFSKSEPLYKVGYCFATV